MLLTAPPPVAALGIIMSEHRRRSKEMSAAPAKLSGRQRGHFAGRGKRRSIATGGRRQAAGVVTVVLLSEATRSPALQHATFLTSFAAPTCSYGPRCCILALILFGACCADDIGDDVFYGMSGAIALWSLASICGGMSRPL
jgi:hypothetical protein